MASAPARLKPKLGGIVKEQVALAGVEQEAARADLEMEGEAVFGPQPAGMNSVLDQCRDDDALTHVSAQFGRRDPRNATLAS